VVTAFDVIEHMEDPKIFLTQLIDNTRPGGYIIIGTGTTDSWAWKLAKSKYYYCWIPEHISFVNSAWFKQQAKELHCVMHTIEEFVHHPRPSVMGLLLQSFTNFIYILFPALFLKIRLLRWRFLGETEKKITDHPPMWNMTRDHLLVVLQKNPVENIDKEINI